MQRGKYSGLFTGTTTRGCTPPSITSLTPRDYYRGNPDELLYRREEKLRIGRMKRKERNMNKRKGGEMAGSVS